MTHRIFRYLVFEARANVTAVCLDAAAIGTGTDTMSAIADLILCLQAGMAFAEKSDAVFVRKPTQLEKSVFDAVSKSRPLGENFKKALGYDGRLSGWGFLRDVREHTSKPAKRRFDLKELHAVGA